jgi:hypothetical protein
MQVFHESDVRITPIFVDCPMHRRQTADADVDDQGNASSTSWILAKLQSQRMMKVNRFSIAYSLEAYGATPVPAISYGPVM